MKDEKEKCFLIITLALLLLTHEWQKREREREKECVFLLFSLATHFDRSVLFRVFFLFCSIHLIPSNVATAAAAESPVMNQMQRIIFYEGTCVVCVRLREEEEEKAKIESDSEKVKINLLLSISLLLYRLSRSWIASLPFPFTHFSRFVIL